METRGTLVLIGTPIGNLGDISARAIESIRGCDLLLCEDTRHSGQLLSHLNLRVPLESFHDYNEEQRIESILERLAGGERVGVVSDAGLPVLSDPGFRLVRAARAGGFRVEPVPGPFAGALALIASGIAPMPFAFFGFAPHRSGERLDFYRDIAARKMTAVVYESPQRIIASLRDAESVFGDVHVSVARELTKLHEEILDGPIGSVITRLVERDEVRGEITLVLAAAAAVEKSVTEETLRQEFQRLRDSGLRRPDAIRILADRYGLRKQDLYTRLLSTE
jgi:16S rRNA (cytidine1402-2'-O)-methyltransferase